MFALRKITKDGVEMNFDLGDSYTLIDKERSPKDFAMFCEHSGYDVEKDSVYAVISCKGGSSILPLYSTQKNYIVTETGSTYQRI